MIASAVVCDDLSVVPEHAGTRQKPIAFGRPTTVAIVSVLVVVQVGWMAAFAYAAYAFVF